MPPIGGVFEDKKKARKKENKKDKKEGELAERSRFRKMPFRIHAAMQDADNLDGILGKLPIEKKMTWLPALYLR